MKELQITNGIAPSLRPVKSEDSYFLFQLYASTRAAEMALVDWEEDKKQAFLEMQFIAQISSYQSNFPQAQHDIVLVEDQQVGRLYVDRTGEEIRLLDITLLPEYRNGGIGSQLMKNLKDEASHEAKPVRFYVWQLNYDAKRFYERHGWKQTREEGAYTFMEWPQH